MISYAFLVLFAAAAVLNLVGAGTKNKILSAVTKPMLLSSLCLFCVLRGSPEPFLVAALAACWLGDVLLMGGGAWFIAGGVSFFAGHVFFIVVLSRRVDFSALPVVSLVCAGLLYAAATIYVMLCVKKGVPKLICLPMFLYLLSNAATNLLALAWFVQSPGLWSAAAFAGAVLFFLSDCALYLMRFEPGRKRFFKTNFFVMLTYVVATLLLTLALTLSR